MRAESPRGVRADAARNRERILEVARGHMHGDSEKISLEKIARDAGVGIGTLYRHFPTRESLIEAVFRAELAQLSDSAEALLGENPPAVALRMWMDGFGDFAHTKREMAGALRGLGDPGERARSVSRPVLAEAAQRLLDAGAADGTLRPDIRGDDVVASLVGIFLVNRDPEQREQAQRMMDLLMAGVRV